MPHRIDVNPDILSGSVPDRALFLRSSMVSPVAPMNEGMLPVNALQQQYRFRRVLILHSAVGMLPVRRFAFAANNVSLVSAEIVAGIDPLKKFSST